MVPDHPVTRAENLGRTLSGLALLVAIAAAAWLLSPRPLADAFFAGWVAIVVLIAAVGTAGAWTDRRPLVWASAALLVGLSVVGMWSIGFYVAPAALLQLAAAVVLQATAGPGSPSRPPSSPGEAVGRAIGGAAAAGLGGWLAYRGAVVRELFTGGCARESLGCALAVTNPVGVALTVLGLAAVVAGGWQTWRGLVDVARGANRAA